MDKGEIILFQTQGGETRIEVRLANESVWLTANQMAELFQRNKSTIIPAIAGRNPFHRSLRSGAKETKRS